MSYHNDPYRVDYLKIYPCLKERPDVLEVLKKSDRKMKYMEVDLKSEQRRKNAENGAESYVPSKEDSLERLVYSAKCQFADDAEGIEDGLHEVTRLVGHHGLAVTERLQAAQALLHPVIHGQPLQQAGLIVLVKQGAGLGKQLGRLAVIEGTLDQLVGAIVWRLETLG